MTAGPARDASWRSLGLAPGPFALAALAQVAAEVVAVLSLSGLPRLVAILRWSIVLAAECVCASQLLVAVRPAPIVPIVWF